ncbi:MAG: glycosyltransferase family 4 protein [Planctomycetes bacterium]|nr:glycosyltransferase family 4 protein [Planctomycetota bacterium]
MRIIYLHQYYVSPDEAGGTRSYEMAREAVARGHEVHMVTTDRTGGGRGWTRTAESGIHVHRYPVAYSSKMGYIRRIRAFFEFAWAASQKAAKLPGDVVYATSTPLTIAFPGVHAARKHSIPMVFEVRDLWPETPIAVGALRNPLTIAAARWLERFAYRNAAHIVALSPGMKEGVVRTGYPAEKVTVLPNISDRKRFGVSAEVGIEFRRRYAWLQDRPLVVYAGALGVVNRVDYLARLAQAVARRDPEIRFLVVGSGKEEEKVRRVAGELAVLDRNFFMLPPVPKADMPAILSAADMCTSVVQDTKEMWNNCANKVFDAHAAGRPILINHQGWHADRIRETGCGLVLHPQDVESSADELVAAIRDRGWLDRACAASRRVAKERFDRDTLAAQWVSVVTAAAGTTRTRAAA